MSVAVVRVALAEGPASLPPTTEAILAAWRGGAAFGLALCGDPFLAEGLFRRLRPLATHVVRAGDADDAPPRSVRTLALCRSLTDLAPGIRRRCTVALDLERNVPPSRPARRASRAEDEPALWRRVVAVLHAHDVHDGAIDVAACALASALLVDDVDDPVGVVRRTVAEPHGRSSPPAPDPGDGEEAAGGDDGDTEEMREAPAVDTAEGSGEGPEGSPEEAPDPGDGDADTAEEPAEQDTPDTDGSEEAGDDAAGAAQRDAERPGAEAASPASEEASSGTTAPPGTAGTAVDAPVPEDPAGTAGILSPRAAVLPLEPARADRARAGRRARAGARRDGSGRGRPGRVVPPERVGGRIAILPSLERAARRRARTGADGPLVWDRDDLRGRLREESVAVHTVVVVDGSSSMGRAGAAHARTVADHALAQVYRDRGEISVVLAAGAWATLVQRRTPRLSRARAALERAPGEGGGTPLADAVRLALAEFDDAPRARCRLVMVTDGCPSVDLSGRAVETSAREDLTAQLSRVADRVARAVLVPLDARGHRPLDRTLAPFRAAGFAIART